ncbi:MAG: arginine--tRNA ligase, partial [bacterium]|nr:arginine--tRNA ligase [bacterium]
MSKKELHKIIAETTGEDSFDIMYPPEGMGDLSCNIAFRLGKARRANPADLAEEIISNLKNIEEINEAFSKIEFAKPGFINFYYSPAVLADNLKKILKRGDDYGRGETHKKDRILIEYFQPNIAKPLHLGHLRTAIIGDSLFKIMEFAGYNIESDTHIGDWGTQFGLLMYAY